MADDFEALLAEAESLPLSGWDASPIRGRWETRAPPWDYRSLVREHLTSASSLLDLGTGGGELLATLAPLPRPTFATEGYPPNLPVAQRRLTPFGVRVLPIGPNNRIDLPSGSVDLVICRHEEFDAREVRRVLLPHGIFVTQQVGAGNYDEINQRLGTASAPPTNHLESIGSLAAEISAAGMRVRDQRESQNDERFLDVGALVWYLRFAPWQVPTFSVGRFRENLREIHSEIGRNDGFAVTACRLLVIAERG